MVGNWNGMINYACAKNANTIIKIKVWKFQQNTKLMFDNFLFVCYHINNLL